jgi:adenosylhomocysteinase
MVGDSESSQTCPSCGSSRSDDARFCRACGVKFEDLEAATRAFETEPTLVLPAGVPTTPIQPLVTDSVAPIDSKLILESMSVLQMVARKKSTALGPVFEGYHFIFILHFLADLLGFMDAFRLMGMSWERAQFLHKPYLYRYKDRIARQLSHERAGVNPLTPRTLETIVRNIITNSRNDGRKIIVVEDGGYVVPLVHRVFEGDIDRFQGAVEQTTKGITEDLRAGPTKFPLLSVAGAKVKREKESPQIAIAVWDNVRRLLSWSHHDLTKPKVLVIGYGSIGMNLAVHLRTAYGATVKVFDQDEAKRQEAAKDGFTVDADIKKLIEREHGLIVIGATGQTSIGEEEILTFEHDSVLVSASSDQREIGTEALRILSVDPDGTVLTDPRGGEKVGDVFRLSENHNDITLLAEGYPINFWNTESMPIKVSQVAMVPLFLAAVALVTNTSEIGIGSPNSDFVDKLVDEENIFNRL